MIIDENPMALEHANTYLKADLNVVRNAYNKNEQSLRFARKSVSKIIIKERKSIIVQQK
jgi:hypothetical protein